MRSGLSMMRDGRVPGVELDHVHLRRADQRLRRSRPRAAPAWPGQSAGSSSLDAGDAELLAVLLEEQLAADAGRAAHQRHRPAVQVRQDPVGDALVVAHEVELGQAGAAVDDAVGVRDLRCARSRGAPPASPAARRGRRRPSRSRRRRPACRRAGRGTTRGGCGRRASTRRSATSATSCGSTQRSLPGAAARPAAALGRGAGVERRRLGLDLRPAALAAARRGLRVPAGADVAGVDAARRSSSWTPSSRLPISAARAAAVGEAADDELLALLALELEPGLGAARDVGRVGALGDHAFEAAAGTPTASTLAGVGLESRR